MEPEEAAGTAVGRRRLAASSPQKSYARPGLSPDRQQRLPSPQGDPQYSLLYKEICDWSFPFLNNFFIRSCSWSVVEMS